MKLGTHILTNEKVAVKTFEKAKLEEPHASKRVAREIRILKVCVCVRARARACVACVCGVGNSLNPKH